MAITPDALLAAETRYLRKILESHPWKRLEEKVYPSGAHRTYQFEGFCLRLCLEPGETILEISSLNQKTFSTLEDLALGLGLDTRYAPRGNLCFSLPQKIEFLETHWDKITQSLSQNASFKSTE